MSHNVTKINTNNHPDYSGNINYSSTYGIGGVTTRMIHSATSNNASVGQNAQIHKGIYSIDYIDSSIFEWVNADGRAIKSNSNYAMGIKLNSIGYYSVEVVFHFDINNTSEYIVVQIVDASDNPMGPKAYYGIDTIGENYPSTLHAVIDNQSVGAEYYFRVQDVSGSVGQPTSNAGTAYCKVIKL